MTTEQREIAEALESFLHAMEVETHGVIETYSNSKPTVCFTFSTAAVKDGKVVVYSPHQIDINGRECADFNTARRELIVTYI